MLLLGLYLLVQLQTGKMRIFQTIVTLLAIPASLVSAAVPNSKRFDLTKPSYDLFRHKTLRHDTVQQGFAFDNVNRRLFVAQRRNKSDEKSGDLVITELDFKGNYVSHMALDGFGHGVSFGAEGVGKDTYLWTEVEANANGYGKKLARFKWVNGKHLSKDSTSLKKFTPVAGATEHTCAIDTANNRLAVRYNKSRTKHIALYDLAAATKGDFSKPLADIKQPTPKTKAKNFQGYTVYGKYLYLLWGDSYDVSGGVVNSELASVDMNTGKVVQGPVLTKAGSTLTFREAEGLAVYKTADGEVRLFMGFASGKGGDRRSNLFYKKALV